MKYKLTDTSKVFQGVTVYQIQALRDFDLVKAGDLGGWVSDDERLSHKGNCWIDNNAIVYERAMVTTNAWATEFSIVRGDALLTGDACLFGNVILEGHARVGSDVQLGGKIRVGGTMSLSGSLRFNSTAELKSYFEKRR